MNKNKHKNKQFLIFPLGVLFSILFISLSWAIKDTEVIWIQTRLFGLCSYFSLLITVLIGELRMLTKTKPNFKIFRYHKPIAIFTVFLVFIHFISAVLDNYKWGKTLSLIQYLGFSFSDQWLVFLSLGTLAFYLMVLVSITSGAKMIRFFGFKKWKLIHYFSYVSFVFAYIHSINLGTDLKSSFLQSIVFPIFLISFLLVLGLLLTRIFVGLGIFSDQIEINLAVAFFLLLVIGSVLFISIAVDKENEVLSLKSKITSSKYEIHIYEQEIQNLIEEKNARETGNG